MLPKKKIGESSLIASVIGFGTWGIGGKTKGATSYGQTCDKTSLDALFAAYYEGINLYDTAPAYGEGHSEILLSKLLKDKERDSIIIATKGGFESFQQPSDFSIEGLLKSLEGSLRRLNTSYIDLFQLHNPDNTLLKNSEQFHMITEKLFENGKIKALGLSVANPTDAQVALENLPIDSIQLNFNLLDQRALELGLLETAKNKNISVITRTPLCFGFLTGALKNDQLFSKDDHRSRWSKEQINVWVDGSRAMISDLASLHNNTPSQVALRFCLSFPAITHTIPGMISDTEVLENKTAGELGPLTESELANIQILYRKQEFFLTTRPERPNAS